MHHNAIVYVDLLLGYISYLLMIPNDNIHYCFISRFVGLYFKVALFPS